MQIQPVHVIGAVLLLIPLAGLINRGWMASFLLSTESIDSPRFSTRWSYRVSVFSLDVIAAILVTPAIGAAIGFPRLHILYLGIFLLVATLMVSLEVKYIRWCDKRKIRAREQLNRIRSGTAT